MKKIIKESGRKLIVIDVIFYTVYVMVGYLLLKFPEIEVLKPIEYATPMFFMFGFFSIIAYFSNRIKGNYEYLILGLINILVGSMVLCYSYFEDTGFILGNAILIYSLCIVLNKGYHTIKLSREKDINMFPKFAVTILLVLLGFLVISNLYNDITMQTLILGYYFLSFGVLSLFEPLMCIIIKNKELCKYLDDLVKEKKDVKAIKNKIKPLKHSKLKRK